jgi:hypothetical protein
MYIKMKITRRQLKRIIKEELNRITEAVSPCNINEWEITVLFDRGQTEIIATSLPPADLLCLMQAGMESDRNFIRIKAGTSGTGSDQDNQRVMMDRVISAQDEVTSYLDGILGPTGLPYAWPVIWNKADHEQVFDIIEPGSVIGGKYKVPSDPDDQWFKDKQYVKITISSVPVPPNFIRLANRFMKATVDRGAAGIVNPTHDAEVYAILKELRDARDFHSFNRALATTHGKSFYTIACSRGWNKRTFGSATVLPDGPTEIDEDDSTVDAELRRLGVPTLDC